MALGLGPELGAVIRFGPLALNPAARWSSFIGDLPAAETLLGSPDPMVAEHAAWAVDRLRTR